MKKALIICLLAAIFALCACSDDSDSGIDGDVELDTAEDESESETDADVKQPVAHGREVLPERVPGEIPRYPEDQELAEGAPEGADCYVDAEHDICSKHSDCVDGDYGICIGTTVEPDDWCRCYYRKCLKDDECQDGKACFSGFCHKSCRDSAECENDGKCVIAGVGAYCGELRFNMDGFLEIGVLGYRCTSANDECESDHDCPADEYCVFDKDKDHFTCVYYKYEGDACE